MHRCPIFRFRKWRLEKVQDIMILFFSVLSEPNMKGFHTSLRFNGALSPNGHLLQEEHTTDNFVKVYVS